MKQFFCSGCMQTMDVDKFSHANDAMNYCTKHPNKDLEARIQKYKIREILQKPKPTNEEKARRVEARRRNEDKREMKRIDSYFSLECEL